MKNKFEPIDITKSQTEKSQISCRKNHLVQRARTNTILPNCFFSMAVS